MTDVPYLPAPEEHIRREKQKARVLRQSQWWKNKCGHGRCHYCGRAVPPRELTMDHVVPVGRGGHTVKGNVVPCCKDCNTQKQHLLPLEWDSYLRHLEAESRPAPPLSAGDRSSSDPEAGPPSPSSPQPAGR